MQPRAELSGVLSHVGGFVQNQPSDGSAASERTEVWAGRTRSTLYFVFVCYDRNVARLRGHLARRENILADDTVSVLLDPFADRRRGVLFSLNSAGVQADAAWTEGPGADYSYDQVWDSDARVTPRGWMALFAIPFRSLRFRTDGAPWGVVLERFFPRNSETDNWPHISTNVAGKLSQEATLSGIGDVTRSHNLQLNPYVLGQNVHTLNTLDATNPFFSNRRVEATAGGEAKAILHDSIVIDATVNPDFSQVESDQPQFTVDQRYPVYFPELRPFFLENANYFATPITLLYTRTIVHPEFGIRATGKLGGTNIGLLAIDDRLPGDVLPQTDALYHHHSLNAVGRVSQDVGKNSSVGAIYVDQEFGGSWNRIGGLDFNARVNDVWTLTGQLVESSTRGADGSYLAGPASYLEASHNSHRFSSDSVYRNYSTGFRSGLGFIQSPNFRYGHTHAEYYFYPKSKILQRFGLETSDDIAFDHQGNRLFRYTTFDPFLLLPRNMVIAPLVGQNSDTVGPQNGYALQHNVNFTENQAGIIFRGQPWGVFNFKLNYFPSVGNVNYFPSAGHTPALLRQNYLQLYFTLQPVHALTMDQTYLLDHDRNDHTHAFVYQNQVMRTKINYQFTRSLSARVIVEYDSTLANAAETTLPRTKQVQTQALLTWLPHPGTAIYVGYNNDLQNLSHTLCTRPVGGPCSPTQPILPRADGYLNDGRQFFVKASYLLRF